IATVIREGYDSTVSGTLNWNEITIDTAEPTSLFEGEDFFIFIMLGKTAWVDLWNGSQGQDETYHGVAFS
ncbi:hypothetical protein JZU71_01175, partial [bacterium]|nr:hypothetical protein [bacterium]